MYLTFVDLLLKRLKQFRSKLAYLESPYVPSVSWTPRRFLHSFMAQNKMPMPFLADFEKFLNLKFQEARPDELQASPFLWNPLTRCYMSWCRAAIFWWSNTSPFRDVCDFGINVCHQIEISSSDFLSERPFQYLEFFESAYFTNIFSKSQ